MGIEPHDQELGSDIVTTLFVNYKWRKIIAESLLFRYDYLINELSEADEDNASEQIQRLIDDLYTAEAIGMGWTIAQVRRNTDQTILGVNVDRIVVWQAGLSFDSSNPTRLTVPAGRVIITAHFQVTLGASGNVQAWIRKNGGEDVAWYFDQSRVTHRVTLTTQDDAFDGDYYELVLATSVNGAFIASLEPQFFATILEQPD